MKKSKLYLTNIEKEHPDMSYEELHGYVRGLIAAGKLAPVKNASINGRTERIQISPMNTQSFTISPIPDNIFVKMQGKSFKHNCTMPREDLRYLKVLHVGFDGKTHTGELVVNRLIADDVLDIFKQLYEAGYEIEKIRLIDEYDADDEKSMSDNNSSAFNFRYISYSTTLSKHALGLAVDINTLYNPYVKNVDGRRNVEPANAEKYTDRSVWFPHKIDHDDLCYKVFVQHGFEWGGDWEHTKDYQHFEMPDEWIEKSFAKGF